MQMLAVMIGAEKGHPQVVKTALQNGDNEGKVPPARPVPQPWSGAPYLCHKSSYGE